jgi:hypothetical protein
VNDRTDAPTLVRLVHVVPFFERCTVYLVIGEPPVLDGATQDTVTDLAPAVARKPVGTPGTVRGVADTVTELPLVPTSFTARTENVYDVPLVNPVTVADVADRTPSGKVSHEPLPTRYNNT